MRFLLAGLCLTSAMSHAAFADTLTAFPRVVTDRPSVSGTACDASTVYVEQEVVAPGLLQLRFNFNSLETSINAARFNDRQSCAVRVRAVSQPGSRLSLVSAKIAGSGFYSEYANASVGLTSFIDGVKVAEDIIYPDLVGDFSIGSGGEYDAVTCPRGSSYNIGPNVVAALNKPAGSGSVVPSAKMQVSHVDLLLKVEACQ